MQYVVLVVFFLAVAVTTVIVARRSGAVGMFDTTVQLVAEAEKIFKPVPGETVDAANVRKLQYVMDKLKVAFPDVNTVILRNLIEAGVDVVKRRMTTVKG